MSQSNENKLNIEKNQKRICDIESDVMANKALVYQSRSMIEENRMMILSNYSAAFTGNRQVTNSNTDEIFANRAYILDEINCDNDVEQNYVLAQKTKSRLDFLKHRSSLTSDVLKISQEMAEVNAMLSKINQKIMQANQSILEFNADQVEKNSEIADGSLRPVNATPDSNAELIAANKVSMEHMATNVLTNRGALETLFETSAVNEKALMENKLSINERRERQLSILFLEG